MTETQKTGLHWFMALDAENGKLLATIEAASVEEASTRLAAIAPMLGVTAATFSQRVLWVPVLQPVDGPPAFREAYFKALHRLVAPEQVAPGSVTLQ